MSRNTANIEQIHPFWVAMWDHLSDFKDVLNLEEVRKAIASTDLPAEHPFWPKLTEAFWTLVRVPGDKESVRFKSSASLPAISTREWLRNTTIDIDDGLGKDFTPQQPAIVSGVNHARFTYDADDLQVLGSISKFFPGMVDTPFGKKKDTLQASTFPYGLLLIERFIVQADPVDDADQTTSAFQTIVEPRADNIFTVQGKKGPFMISVRKKLNEWHMHRVEAGDHFRGEDVYVFI